MNIITHSIANMVKRLLVVFLLYSFGKRSATAWNFLGLTITFAGLYIYLMGKLKNAFQNTRLLNTQQLIRPSRLLPTFVTLCLFLMATISLKNIGRFPTGYSSSLLVHGCKLNYTRSISTGLETKEDKLCSPEIDKQLDEFLTWRLVDHPEETDLRAKTLTTNVDIIEEAQRVLINLLSDLIGPIQHVMLMDISISNNKGDSALTCGEVMLMRKMNKSIVYYCETFNCNNYKHLQQEIEISKKYTKDNLVILMHSGGNVVGYSEIDEIRNKIMDRYPTFKKILLSQSIWLNDKNYNSLINAQKIYSNRTNLTIFLRDRQSLGIAKKYFHGIRLILAPDLAFNLGALPRQMPPIYDIIWLQRKDKESSGYALPNIPKNISVHISDWTDQWTSSVGTRDLETSFLAAFSGINFLQRGRVVVTDRLHGHILSTLLNIPHVLIDNPPYFKLSSFDNSWTYSLENTVIVDNGTIALEKAMEFLNKYEIELPQVGPVDMNRFPKLKK